MHQDVSTRRSHGHYQRQQGFGRPHHQQHAHCLNMPFLVAAYGVFSQITVFVRAAWYAPADTLMAFTGVFIGEEDRESIKYVQRISLLHSLMMTSVVTVLLFLFCDSLASFFLRSDNPEALRLAEECIRVSCLSLPFHSIVYNFNNLATKCFCYLATSARQPTTRSR